jgi:hypothetical protein
MDDYARFVLDRAKAATRAPTQNIEHHAVPAQRPAKRKRKRV